MSSTFTIKLFDTVNNPSLPKLGEYPFDIDSSVTDLHAIEMSTYGSPSGGYVRTSPYKMCNASGDYTDYEMALENTASNNYPRFKDYDGMYIFVGGYENMSLIRDIAGIFINVDFSRLITKMPRLTNLFLARNTIVSGSLNDIPNPDLFKIIELPSNPNLSGSIEVFRNNTALTQINIPNTPITGQLSTDLAKATKLTRIRLHNTNITLDYEDLFDALYANGKHDGNILVTYEVSGAGYRVYFTENGWQLTDPSQE